MKESKNKLFRKKLMKKFYGRKIEKASTKDQRIKQELE
jgi:hypothetical protein